MRKKKHNVPPCHQVNLLNQHKQAEIEAQDDYRSTLLVPAVRKCCTTCFVVFVGAIGWGIVGMVNIQKVMNNTTVLMLRSTIN